MSHLKFFIGVVLFGLCSRLTLAQESLQSRFGIQISYGNPGYIPSFADGAPSYEGKNFFDFGFLYLKPISDKWEFESGLFYSSNRFRVTPTIPIGFPNDPYILTMNNWVLPANFRLWLPKRFFIQGGPNLSQDSRSSFGYFRLGFSFGFGKEFKLGDKYDLLITPTFNATPYFPTNSDGVTQLGIKSIFVFPTKK